MIRQLITGLQIALTFLALTSNNAFSQSKGEYMSLFTAGQKPDMFYGKEDNGFVTLRLDRALVKSIRTYKKESLAISIPAVNSKETDMNLKRFKVLADDFVLSTSRGDTIDNYGKGIFYRGKLVGSQGKATLCFVSDKVYGIVAVKDGGNYNIVKSPYSQDYIVYNDRDIEGFPPFQCMELEKDNYEKEIGESRPGERTPALRDGNASIKVYLEGDYALYQNKGSVTAAADYIIALFAQVVSLYADAGIALEIKEIKIWVTQDNYSTTNSSEALMTFRTNNIDVEADLAHLLALGGNNTGGTAWIDVLCNDDFHFAYSNICSEFNNVPVYSWSVECVAHETGHNIGSWHTHECVWNGDNSQIDDCGNEYKAQKGEPVPYCYDPDNPLIPESGTIMSYCHLLSGVGIDFNKGFDAQVADTLRAHFNNASCLTGTLGSACDIPVNTGVDSIASTSAVVTWNHSSGSDMWQIEYGEAGFEPGNGILVSGIVDTFYQLTGLGVGDIYEWYIRSDCGNGEYSSWVGPGTFKTKCIDPMPVQLPFFEGWEEDSGYLLKSGGISCSEYHTWQFVTDHDNDGARIRWGTYCQPEFVKTDSGALVMDRKWNGDNTVNYAILTLNMSNYTGAQNLYLRFSFMSINDENHENDKVWVRGSDTSTWLVAYDLLPESRESGEYYTVKIDLDSLLASGGQDFSSTFQLRLGQEDNYPAVSDGIAYDDIKIFDCSGSGEDGFGGDISCWSTEDSNGDGITWTFNQPSPCVSNACGLVKENYDSKGSYSLDDWLFSSAYYLEAGQRYNLKFAVADQGENEKLEVLLSLYNDSQGASSNGLLLFRDEGLNNEDCMTSSIEFVPQVSADYYIAFHGFSNSYTPHHLFIDDFSIEMVTGQSGYSIEDNNNNNCEMIVINGVAGNAWHNFVKNGHIIASVNPHGHQLGQVSVQVRDGGEVEWYNIDDVDVKTIPRYFNFETTSDFDSTVSLRLYFLQDELDEYNNTLPLTSDEVSQLQVNHYDGDNENCYFGDNDDAGTNIDAALISTGTAGNIGYFIQVEVNSFSEFLIHQNTANTMAIDMQLKLNSKGDQSILYLSVPNQIGIERYIFERKQDDSNIWKKIKDVPVDNSKSEYVVYDRSEATVTYYRVAAVDFDGSRYYSRVVVLNKKNELEIKALYPNPGKGKFVLQLSSLELSPVHLDITDIYGHNVYAADIDLNTRSFQYHMDLQNVANGVYFLSITRKDKRLVRKLLIEK